MVSHVARKICVPSFRLHANTLIQYQRQISHLTYVIYLYLGFYPPGDTISMNYTLRTSGSPFTTDFRIYVERSSDHKLISPWHDIPLYPDGGREGRVVNMVVEIPRFGNAKMEVLARRK